MSDKNTNNKVEEKEPIFTKRDIVEWIVLIAGAICAAVLLNTFVIVNAIIPSGSMETTIMTGDRIFGNRLAYKSEGPQRGDIVIFKYPDDESQLFIKRVIGLPGDTLEVKSGLVYINGSDTPLDETYVKEEPLGDYGPVLVPEGAYFMMGDNRNNSRDSRLWINHFVYKDKILGKALVRYYPHVGKIEN